MEYKQDQHKSSKNGAGTGFCPGISVLPCQYHLTNDPY